MRIHTNATAEAIYVADLPGVSATITEHRSQTHARAFELQLSGNGKYGSQYGNSDFKSATWDEWGVVMARIFAIDPSTRMGGSAKRPIYADAEDFRWQTNGRFGGWGEVWLGSGPAPFIAKPGLPEDTHPMHRWNFTGYSAAGSYSVAECKKCSALKRWRVVHYAHAS